jgi:NAD(P)-dependent dehydrogenase (short-subunit alcohol dehydrogenase family)
MDHDMLSLAGRVAIVTGGASGIGRATALAFVRRGARVVIADLDEARGREAVRMLEEAGGQARFQATDVASPEAVTALVAHAVDAYGQLDVMFNNAGVAAGGQMLDWTPEQYARVVAVNQSGVFYGMQAAARVMRDAGRGGVIINTGSVFGELASRYCIGYQAAKAAVEVMTKVAALELAPHRIRVVNVAPGIVDTQMTDDYRRVGIIDQMAKKQMRGELVSPESVAQVVAFLATDAASAINGTTVFADDGYSAFK